MSHHLGRKAARKRIFQKKFSRNCFQQKIPHDTQLKIPAHRGDHFEPYKLGYLRIPPPPPPSACWGSPSREPSRGVDKGLERPPPVQANFPRPLAKFALERFALSCRLSPYYTHLCHLHLSSSSIMLDLFALHQPPHPRGRFRLLGPVPADCLRRPSRAPVTVQTQGSQASGGRRRPDQSQRVATSGRPGGRVGTLSPLQPYI